MSGRQPQRRKNRRVVGGLVGIVAGMGVLMYYAVPLYEMFCQVTGIGGTTQRAEAASEAVGERTVTVRFNTDTHPDLPWRFGAERQKIELKLGENALVHFYAENRADRAIVGHAAYNVTPLKVGRYVNKIECFCFTEERLGAGERARMPVQLFIDPELARDPNAREVKTVTLSYTFFESKSPEGAKDLKRLSDDADAHQHQHQRQQAKASEGSVQGPTASPSGP